MAKAQELTTLPKKSILVRGAQEGLIQRETARRLARLGGSEPDLTNPPRRQRRRILKMLHDLPEVSVASDDEVLRLVDQNTPFGIGIGYFDAHLLIAVRLTGGATFWTRDKRLRQTAQLLGLATERIRTEPPAFQRKL